MLRATLRLFAVSVAAYASSCVVGPPRERAEAPPAAPAPRAPIVRAVALPQTVVAPDDVPAVHGPMPWNPEADLDRAGLLAEGADGSGEIALTFDDGPAPETTTEVLRILAAHKVKGAFFLTGRRLEGSGVVPEVNRGIARAIVDAGHVVGNHGLDHLAVNRAALPWNAWQIEDSARAIVEATGAPVRYFRPPYGKMGPAAQEVLAARRDELVMWTIDGQDTIETKPEHLTTRLVGQIVYAGQGIVLLHDLRGSSVRALALLLDWLEAHPRDEEHGTGYRIVDLPTFLAHAAARPYPYKTRMELYHARERVHAALRAKSS